MPNLFPTPYTVLTAAGDSRGLFIPAGFGAPKSLVRWRGREILSRAIDSYVVDPMRSRIAVNADEDESWSIEKFVSKNHSGLESVLVPSAAKGALASAVLCLSDWQIDLPLVVAAGDSSIAGGIQQMVTDFQNRDLDAATIGFASTNPRWSYLDIGPSGDVRRVAEKSAIGPIATTGVFYFRSTSMFIDAAKWCFVNNSNFQGRFFVSHTLNFLISSGLQVGYCEVPRSRYSSWSLPADFVEQSE